MKWFGELKKVKKYNGMEWVEWCKQTGGCIPYVETYTLLRETFY